MYNEDEQDILREQRVHQDIYKSSYTTVEEHHKWLKDEEDIEYRLFWCRLRKLGLDDGFRIFIKRLPNAVSGIVEVNNKKVNKDV
jgi:hypothetical protein